MSICRYTGKAFFIQLKKYTRHCRTKVIITYRKQTFIDWARKNVILLELDYPRKTKLAPELQQQNAELQQVFRISGYPTVWLFFLTDDVMTKKKNIEPLGSLGYPNVAEMGKEEISFLHTADSILNVKRNWFTRQLFSLEQIALKQNFVSLPELRRLRS